jgi:hypothetical protein
LKESGLRGVAYFVALAVLTGRDVRSDGLAQTWPEVLTLDRLVGPGDARVRSIGRLVMFPKDELVQAREVRDAKTSFVVVKPLTLLHLGNVLG